MNSQYLCQEWNRCTLKPSALGQETTRHLKTRIIIDDIIDEKSLREAFQDSLPKLIIELRQTAKTHSHYLIIDYQQVMMATSPKPSLGKLPYLWTDTVGFAEILQKDFEDLWANLQAKTSRDCDTALETSASAMSHV